MISNKSLQTLAMFLASFQPTGGGGSAVMSSRPEMGIILAGYTIASIPLLLIFSFGMKYFIEGLSSGAIKS